MKKVMMDVETMKSMGISNGIEVAVLKEDRIKNIFGFTTTYGLGKDKYGYHFCNVELAGRNQFLSTDESEAVKLYEDKINKLKAS